MSSQYNYPHPQQDPNCESNLSYQEQHHYEQGLIQQHHLQPTPLQNMPGAHTAQAGPNFEAQVEIEALRQRIEHLQRPQEPPQYSEQAQPPPAAPDSPYNRPKLYSGANGLAPPGPPAYAPSATHSNNPMPYGSSRSMIHDLSSLPSVPSVPTLDPSSRSSLLPKPIAIPATNAKVGSPFLRAYAPCLANHALPAEVFIRFIDDLNRVAVASPPLQVLGLAGTVVGFVPMPIAQIVGNAVAFASQAGTVAVSKGRTELYLRDANKDIFAPRGLKVEIAKLEAIAKIASIPLVDSSGKINKQSRLLADLEVEELHTMSGQERRLRALSPYIAPLEVTPLPTIERQGNPLSRLNQAASERQRHRGERKLIEGREKSQAKVNKESNKAEREYAKEMGKLDRDEEKVRREKDGRKLDKELEKIEKDRRKVEKDYEKDAGKALKEDEEEKAFRKILWLVIRDLEDGSYAGQKPQVQQGA